MIKINAIGISAQIIALSIAKMAGSSIPNPPAEMITKRQL
jgi:hypothetical protein